jgi:hypothetical protein
MAAWAELDGGADGGLGQPPEVGLDHAGDARIAAGRIGIGHLHDGLACERHLHDARNDTITAQFQRFGQGSASPRRR